MPLLQVVFILIIVGVLLWLLNTFAAEYIDGKILRLINVVVIVACILWLLSLFFGGLGSIGNIRLGR